MTALSVEQAQSPIEDLLRFNATRPSELAKSMRARVVLDLGTDGSWTLFVDRGGIDVRFGEAGRWDTRISTDVATLTSVLEGRKAGAQAYLESRIKVRGNLALALKIESIFERENRPRTHPRPMTVNAGGIQTFYLEAGDEDPARTPVILLHGLGATNASFLPVLLDLAKTRRVIAPDLPGFGESGKPVRAYHAKFYSEWLKRFMNTLGLDQADLIGNSMGGRIALEAAIGHPEKVRRLVLLTPSLAFIKGRQFVPLVHLLRSELAVVPLLFTRKQAISGIRNMFARPARLPDCWYESAVDEFMRVFATPRGRMALFSAARQIYLEPAHGRKGFWDRLPSVKSPALFVWGQNDWLVPAKFARHVSAALPSAESVVLEECGHVPQFELPRVTNKLIRRFLA